MNQLVNNIKQHYTKIVKEKHPTYSSLWPLLSGCNLKVGELSGWEVIILINTGNSALFQLQGLGSLSKDLIDGSEFNKGNKSIIRSRLEKFFQIGSTDAIIFKDSQGNIDASEFEYMLRKHEKHMGISPMKLFLSHKGKDKSLVREYKKTLVELGFDTWLDEDAMSAGIELERGLLEGFRDSCAAIFFITPHYKDENYLATEINYAISEKRKKQNEFAIITLVFEEKGEKGIVPDLLQPYVWKEPQNDLVAIREIIKALPIQLGEIGWK